MMLSGVTSSSFFVGLPISFEPNGIQNGNRKIESRVRVRPSSCSSKSIDEPILKEALTEPVAFFGGMFAGLLRLDLNEDPLKEWLSRTVEASGITIDDIAAEGPQEEDETPQEIEIE